MLPGVDDENGRTPEPDDELPGVLKTVNQIVARNITYYRRAAGITQEQLGELIGGRSKRNVSSDERSWDGGHTREFNASELAALAVALDVPVAAFFLPPEDDGSDANYMFRPHDNAEPLGMGDLMEKVMPDSRSNSRAMDAYRRRMTAAVRDYMAPSWSDDWDYWRSQMSPGPEMRAEEAEDLRADVEALYRLAAKLDRGLTAYEEQKAKEEAGQ
jgi:transcriptional regulator with XRE-family HTH domain